MLYYLVVIGLINLGLGYALAVYLDFGPPNLSAAWYSVNTCLDPLLSRRKVIPAPSLQAEPVLNQPIVPAAEPMLPEEPVSQTIDEPVPSEEPISHLAMLDDSDTDDVLVQPAFEAYDDDAADLLRRDQPENWESNSKYVETSILNLNVSMMKSGVRAIELDNRLRSCKGHTDAATIEECLAQLKEDCQTYLDELSQSAGRFQGRVGESDELSKLLADNDLSNLDPAAQVETTLNNLENQDFLSDLEVANQRLIGELDHLRVARHAWRDTQESTILAFARIDNDIDKIDKQLHNDPTTGLPNRIGLEVMLEAWWQEGRHQQQPIAAVLLDIDALGKHNRAHGALVGDAILYQVARYLRTTVDAADAVGRAGGGSFVVVMPSGGIQAGCATAELLRQSIEQIHFKQGDETLRVTVSAGVAESGTEDRNREPMFARLAESLKMAKRSGHNQTFFFDGEGPRLVDPPALTVAPLEITI